MTRSPPSSPIPMTKAGGEIQRLMLIANGSTRCYAKSPTAQDALYYSMTGVTTFTHSFLDNYLCLQDFTASALKQSRDFADYLVNRAFQSSQYTFHEI